MRVLLRGLYKGFYPLFERDKIGLYILKRLTLSKVRGSMQNSLPFL